MGKPNTFRRGFDEGSKPARVIDASMIVMLLTNEVERLVRDAGLDRRGGAAAELRGLAESVVLDVVKGVAERNGYGTSLKLAASQVRLAELEAGLTVMACDGRISRGRLKTFLSITNTVRRYCATGCCERCIDTLKRFTPS